MAVISCLNSIFTVCSLTHGYLMAAVEMKFIFIFALLVYTKFTVGQKNVCPSSCNPINVNVNGKEGIKGEKGERGASGTPCKCNLQDPNKPSAHIEAVNKGRVTYKSDTVIKDWSASAPYSHLAGGMKYHDGKLTVPTPGRYYIYAQIYYRNNRRVYVRVNGKAVTMIQPKSPGSGEGALYVAGVFTLKAGDKISLVAANTDKIYMYSYHSYFGAFLI